ncbi:MAG: ROK family protein [Phycisphaerales bacterium]|nr:ROK family protein [Phycisphaerales bacterium]
MIRVGIDLGGTKIAACALAEGGEELARSRVATPVGSYEGTIAAIATLVKSVEAEAGGDPGAAKVGIGFPGSVSPTTGLHRNANSTCLNGRDLVGDLSAMLGRAVRGANDANCLALSEALDGAAKDARVVFAVILGTGVGGGVVVDRRIVEGRNAIGGEWGHCPLPLSQSEDRARRPCYCGKFGCTEQFISGPALEADYQGRAGVSLPLCEIDAMARGGGDPHALATIDALCHRLADALASVVNILDPDAIVLGGGVSLIAAIYERVPELVRARVFADRFETPIIAAKFGDASGVRGAARLWDARA